MKKHLKNQFQILLKNYIKAKNPKRIVPFQFDWDLFFAGKELI